MEKSKAIGLGGVASETIVTFYPPSKSENNK